MSPLARLTRRAVLVVCLVPGATACKRTTAPKATEVWDDESAPERTDALGRLAPPWPAPTRAVLEDGLLTYWLHEPGTPALHVRLLVPTTARRDPVPAALAAVLAEHLRSELQRRLERYDFTVDLDHGAGRFEVAIHGRTESLSIALRTLGAVLGSTDRRAALLSTRALLAETLPSPSAEVVATATLTRELLGLPKGSGLVEAVALERLDAEDLVRGWTDVLDPRGVVLVVHAGRPATQAKAELRRLSEIWTGVGKRPVHESAVERTRGAPPSPRSKARLLAEPAAPLRTVGAPGLGRPALVLGRVIPTGDHVERAMARLVQRLAQEEIDARLVSMGDRAVLVVVAGLSRSEPERSAAGLVEKIAELSRTRPQRQRLQQAASLWLGARVVQASLSGEDWTALWSEAIDLADDEADIAAALARDAEAMLAIEPDALQAWQARWFDPRQGEPGWAWVVAGADERVERRLARVTRVEGL